MTQAPFRERITAIAGAQVISFTMGGEVFACDVMLVQEVVTRRQVHPLPDMPPRLLGMIRLREELVPVIDVAPMLDLRLADASHRTLLIVESEDRWMGVATDGVSEVLHLSATAFRPAAVSGRDRDEYVLGVTRVEGMVVTLIDLAEMLRDQTTFVRGESA
jgi:purine-binding chemotaxis protein CheW